ncbi:5-formyltetrahydrofolate cyclo-ligase [Gammaproteobacteria bacterium]|nr:5-formyltetrahydrofolate cyclo-ligase [Gammaproteobacteria bacterium]
MPKNKLRKKLFQKNQSMSSEYKKLASAEVQKTFLDINSLNKAKNILLYKNIKGEMPTDKIMLESQRMGIGVYFPVVADNYKLSLIKCLKGDRFKKNKYGIDEPEGSEQINPENLSIAIVPFVGVDNNGYRLGNGGGYYDRLFRSLPERSDLVIAGLGFDYQIISDNFKEDHDLKYDLVITEKQKYFF